MSQPSLFDLDEPTGVGAYGQPATIAKPSRAITNADQIDPVSEKAKREAQKREILAELRRLGRLPSSEVLKMAPRVSGRIFDLRQDGHDIETDYDKGIREYVYILHEPPREPGGVNASASDQ